jgi:F-type H+-transporting ATPase subunit epsilon
MAERKALPGSGGLEVDVVTPTGPIAHTRTTAVIAPGELGEFQVLPGHIPFLTKLHAGVLVLGESRARGDVYAVSGGFLEVSPTGQVRVLVERALAAADIDAGEAKLELDATARELEAWKKGIDADYRSLRARNDWARARIDARRSGAGAPGAA